MRRRAFLALAAALLGASAARAGAAPAKARGTAPAATRFDRGVLWRVTQRGRTRGHVFGTMHVADDRLAQLPTPVAGALEGSKRLMVEFLPSPYSKERFLESAMFLDRQTLEEKIGQPDFERVVAHLRPIGLSRTFISKLKPWGVLVNLRNPAGGGQLTLDEQILAHARRRRLPVDPLENVEEQVFTFDEFPMDSQVALLRHALANQAELAALAAETLEAYLRRDLAAIWRLQQAFVARHPEIARHNAVFVKRVVLDRSVVMAFRMQRGLRRGAAFVVLGAMHLHGPKGVLALLEDDGYRVRRVW